MTQQEAVEKGYTHFIEAWRHKNDREGENSGEDILLMIRDFDYTTSMTKSIENVYTVCVWLIKPKKLN